MRKLIIFILITAILIFAQLQLKTRELIKADDSDFIFTFTSAGDSLQLDSIGSIVTARINTAQTAIETIANDSNIALESRTINRSDSLSTALIAVIADSTGAILDSARTVLTDSKTYAEQVWIDSSSQSTVIFDNDVVIHDNLTIDSLLILIPIATESRPGSPVEGTIYIDDTVDSLKVYINGNWYNIDMTIE